MFIFSPAHADLNTGLVANYSFDDCTAKDNSGNGHDGTINGNPQCVDGVKGKAFSFDGVDDFILVNSDKNFPETAITMSYWLNRKENVVTSGNAEFYFAKEYAFQSFIMDNGTLHSAFWTGRPGDWTGYDDTYSGNFLVNYAENEHYVLTFDNATKTAKTYINGKLVKTFVEPNPNAIVRSSNEPLYIGHNGYSNWTHLKGIVDEARIYNRAISETEVKSLYNLGQLSGTVNGVQKYSAVCKNLKTGVTKKIALADGATEWNCTAAGLKAKKGENVNISITGVSK